MSNFDDEVIDEESAKPKKSKALEKKFDAAKKAMPPPPKKIRLADSNRKQGRPHGGHVKVTQKRVDALEETTYETKLARTLGIARGTLAQWIDPDKSRYTLPYVEENGHRLFRRDIVLKWLKETGRWVEREEYRNV